MQITIMKPFFGTIVMLIKGTLIVKGFITSETFPKSVLLFPVHSQLVHRIIRKFTSITLPWELVLWHKSSTPKKGAHTYFAILAKTNYQVQLVLTPILQSVLPPIMGQVFPMKPLKYWKPLLQCGHGNRNCCGGIRKHNCQFSFCRINPTPIWKLKPIWKPSWPAGWR